MRVVNDRVCVVDGCANRTRGPRYARCREHLPTRPCEFDGCDRPVDSLGLCVGHVAQKRAGKELSTLAPKRSRAVTCDVPGCGRVRLTGSLCAGHHRQQKAGKPLAPLADYAPQGQPRPCAFGECDRAAKVRGLCDGHSQQAEKGQPLRTLIERVPPGTYTDPKDRYRRSGRLKAQAKRAAEDPSYIPGRTGFRVDRPSYAYIVTGRGLVKFGIANGGPRAMTRLRRHARAGLPKLLLRINLPTGWDALAWESQAKAYRASLPAQCHATADDLADGWTEAMLASEAVIVGLLSAITTPAASLP